MTQQEREQEDRRDRRAPKKKTGRGFGDYKFVDINLSEEEKEVFRAEHVEDAPGSLEMLESWVASGYKVSVSADDRGGGVLVSITSRFGSVSNEGYILTARAGYVEQALQVLWYKDMYICDAGAWAETAEKRSGLAGDIG